MDIESEIRSVLEGITDRHFKETIATAAEHGYDKASLEWMGNQCDLWDKGDAPIPRNGKTWRLITEYMSLRHLQSFIGSLESKLSDEDKQSEDIHSFAVDIGDLVQRAFADGLMLGAQAVKDNIIELR